MNSLRYAYFALILVIAGSLSWAQITLALGDQRPADRDAIRHHIEKVFEAYIHNDRDAIRASHAADWRGYISLSRQIIRGVDQYMQASDNVQKYVPMLGYKILDLDTVFYGDVAVVPYIAQVEVNIGGAPVTSKLRVLDVYAKLAGEWVQVASNTVVHPDAQEAFEQNPLALSSEQKQKLLAMRESVWRAWFSNDHAQLEQMIPPETVAIDAGRQDWENRDQVLSGAEEFAKNGGRLARLEFPQTEIQVYGPIAVLYSKYVVEMESKGKRETQSGRATEVFVDRRGKWVNAGWHLDSGQ